MTQETTRWKCDVTFDDSIFVLSYVVKSNGDYLFMKNLLCEINVISYNVLDEKSKENVETLKVDYEMILQVK